MPFITTMLAGLSRAIVGAGKAPRGIVYLAGRRSSNGSN